MKSRVEGPIREEKATSAHVPVAHYLRTVYEPDAEFVDGQVELRAAAELDHASWQQAIAIWLTKHTHLWGLRALPSLKVQVTPTRYRVPDVVVFERGLPEEQILTRPPVAVFEVLSPEDTISRLMVKLADHAEMGVRNIFVVEPRRELFYRYEDGSLELGRAPVVQLEGAAGHVDWRGVAELRD